MTFTKAVLTVTADDKRPRGQPNTALTASITAFVNGDALAVVIGICHIAVGNVTLAAADYSFLTVAGTLTVGKAHLTVTADNNTKVYRSPNPALIYIVTGFVKGEALTTTGVTGSAALTTIATAASPVGTHPITVAVGSWPTATTTSRRSFQAR
jgi:hypothetical protein